MATIQPNTWTTILLVMLFLVSGCTTIELHTLAFVPRDDFDRACPIAAEIAEKVEVKTVSNQTKALFLNP